MKKIILGLCVLGLVGCNNKAEVPNKIEVVTSGTATVAITVNLQIIDQLTVLCEDNVAVIPYASEAERKHAVSQCVFDHLSNIGASTSALTDFASQYCGVNVTPETLAACTAIGK